MAHIRFGESAVDDFRRPEAGEHYQRAVALEQAGRIDEALVEYRRTVDVDPGFAAAYEALGYHYQRRGLLTKALDAFQTLARLEDSYNAYFNAGYILVELERYEEALEAFRRCLALVPQDPAALYEIAYLHYVQGHLEEALQAAEVPARIHADDWRLHNLMGACHLGLERWAEAEASYARALALAADAEEVEESRAGLLIAQRYQEYPPGTVLGLKERLYADAGVVVLGTEGDDGLYIVPREHLALSAAAVAVTVGRLQALAMAWPFQRTAVVAVDRASQPLAAVLAERLAVSQRTLSQLQPQDRPLLVLLAGRQPELLLVALEQTPKDTLSFVFALGWYGQHDLLPDLLGVPVDEIPEPGPEQAPHNTVAPFSVEELRSACQSTPPEPNSAAQVRYYTHEHRRLRFHAAPGPDAPVVRPSASSPEPGKMARAGTLDCAERMEH